MILNTCGLCLLYRRYSYQVDNTVTFASLEQAININKG